MIIAYVGTPGSGKTYEAVKAIIDNLKTGRIVYTNIDGLDHPKCQEAIKSVAGISHYALTRQLKHLTNDEIQYFWEHICPKSLIVIDEVHKLFSNRDWKDSKNRMFGNWASTHRHQGNDVILITQHSDKMDAHVKTLVEWTYLFRKVNFFGDLVSKSYLCFAHSGYDCSSNAVSKKKKTYDSAIFKCYKSYDFEDMKELDIIKKVNVLNHPIFWGLGLSLLMAVFFFSKSSFIKGKIFPSAKGGIVKEAQASEPKKYVIPDHAKATKKLDQKTAQEKKLSYRLSTSVKYTKTGAYVYIFYDNQIFNINDFPYTVSYRNKTFYAQLPQSEFKRIKGGSPLNSPL